MKTRHDAWTLENDQLLAETVLSYVQNGHTQSAAFKDIGNRLNRTAAACGYRWNAELRKKYKKEFEQAKMRRKEVSLHKKDAKNNQQVLQHGEVIQLTIDECIHYLSQVRSKEYQNHILDENIRLTEENKKLYDQKQALMNKYEQLTNQKQKIDHKFKALFRLINEVQLIEEEKQLYH
ncbi:RsfA family transcriptional regulator [Metabacillus halosaccharovorans]|uniref:RsfA family transcriptional regulator n=1 Tax=Metabacillus halosaccharovorans TaxID=930124 RepID=UPI001C1F86A7|nr:RsfA family transcriptional regulator [Metabacillus halosaccharovorans]